MPIDCVAGTSVGALIGAVYCAGVPLNDMQRIASLTTFADFGRWTPSWLGLANNLRLERYLQRFTPLKTFEELTTPFAVAATDINAGISVYYTRGPIGPPLRGSCAYPGLFVPIQFEGRTLVDGFLTAPVPVEGTMPARRRHHHRRLSRSRQPHRPTHRRRRHQPFVFDHPAPRRPRLAQQADVIIEPDVKPFVWDDFTRTDELIAAGESAAQAALPEILKAFAADKNRPGLT